MPRIHERVRRVFRKGAGGRQTHQDVPPVATSASITPEEPPATSSQHVQQEQSGDSVPSTSPINSQQPSTPQSLWDQAYDALAKKMPDLVKKYDELLAKEQMANSTPDETTPVQLPAPHDLDTRSDRPPRQVQLETVIRNGLQRMEDNKATFKIAGHEFVLADQITKAASFLLWGKDWIGSAVKDSPEASLVWSGLCLIFPLITNPTTAAEANQDGFAYVTSRMRYYVALEPLLHRLRQNAKVDEVLVSAANDHIVDLYQAILEFQLSSVLRFYQSRPKTYVLDILPSRDWEKTLLGIKTREDTVNNDLRHIDQLVAREELELLNKTSEDMHATMENCLSVATQQLAVLKEQLAAQLAAQEGAQQEKLLAEQRKCLQAFWLKPNAKGATYDWYKGRVELRVEGTCEWFLQHGNFQKWLLQESGPLLVSADPGCGKSVLAKYLIDHGLTQQSATICYFFFKDQDQNTIRQALCALLHQLFSQKRTLLQHAMELFNDMGAELIQSEKALWSILRDAVCDPQAGPVIFVIDALDECDESQLGSLITTLKAIFCDKQLANAKFRVLMTSRPYQHVVSEFRSLRTVFQHIHIPGEEDFETIGQEINSVIHHRVEQLADKHDLPDNIKTSLARKLLAIDHRTYLWVYLVFDYLDKGFKTTDDGIDAAIQALPKSVNQAYNQILNRSQDNEAVEIIKKALSIILAARRPLTLSEMNIAMNLDGQGRGGSIYDLHLEQDKHFKTRLRTLCGLFVNVHHDKVYFLHQTAREFLIQSSVPTTVASDLQWHHSITHRYAHSVLAEICMFYLDRLNSTNKETFRNDDHHGAFLQYSVTHWGDHCREAEYDKGSVMVDLASGLCTPDLSNQSQWASIISRRYHIRPGSITNVLVASQLGLTPVTEFLLSSGADIEAKDSQGRTALILAAKSGHEAVTRLLLDNGANTEAKDDKGWTALIQAAVSGHEPVARLLLESGADVEAKDGDGWTALILAAESGHEAIVRLLLDNGANTEAKDDKGWTALIQAAVSGHEPVARLLLDNGANIEAKNGQGRTAFILAAKSGHEPVMRLLLENGADVKARTTDGWTALMHVALLGREAMTRLLLDNGANIEAKNGQGRTAFILAAKSGHEPVMRLLLENGADVEGKHDHDRSALMLAAKSGHEAVTRLLLDNGANTEAKDDKGWTALIQAAVSGHEPVARLLLESGADVEAKDGDGWTALILAAESGHEAIVRLLLDNGANTEAKDDKGWTALILAADSGHEPVMRLLLENGADVKAKGGDGWTALILAAKSGHEPVMRLLLESGADVKAKGGDGWTALILAAKSGHEPVMRLLLESGADVEAKDGDGWTALILAARSGHEPVIRLLLKNGANIEAKTNLGRTALILAADSGHEPVMRLLLENGADVEAKHDDDWTALMLAANSGREAVALLLLENGANIEAKNSQGKTAMMVAAKSGHEAVARLLLEIGADTEAKTDAGTTALLFAARSGHEAVARLLLENDANVEARNNDGWTALIQAAVSGHEPVARLLLESGADVEAKNNNGTTALSLAAKSGHEAVTRLLLENGANIEAKNSQGRTALMLAADSGHEPVIRLLLENAADVEARDDDGWTALMVAAKSGHEPVARLLLENSADIEARDDDGWTALIHAANPGHEAVMRLLLDNGVNVEARTNDGRIALEYASETATRLLLKNGSKFEAEDVEGSTATVLSIKNVYRSVRQLLSKKA